MTISVRRLLKRLGAVAGTVALTGLAVLLPSQPADAAPLGQGAPVGIRIVEPSSIDFASWTFAPNTAQARVGDTVVWVNDGQVVHTATAPDGFDSGVLQPGERFSLVATTPGTYQYLCRLHQYMVGTLVVHPADGPSALAAPGRCRFVLGFERLRGLLGAGRVGDCLEDERHNPENGDALQRTTGGLLVWRKSDNRTAFTDGGRTWIDTADGLRSRGNAERFPWED